MNDDEEYFYDQAEHRWISEREMRSRQKYEKASNTLIIVVGAILGGGGCFVLILKFGKWCRLVDGTRTYDGDKSLFYNSVCFSNIQVGGGTIIRIGKAYNDKVARPSSLCASNGWR